MFEGIAFARLLLARRTGQIHLYFSAALTLALKVFFLPWLLHRVEGPLRISDYPPARLAMVLKLLCLACAALAYLCCQGTFHGPQVNQSFLLSTMLFTGLSILCAGADVYWRVRRNQQEREWLRILQERTYGTRAPR